VTRVTVPSLSEAVALSAMVAGDATLLPADGLVTVTVGALLKDVVLKYASISSAVRLL
jgi:hypothetical protein